jgi:methanogenic corrinoid protein MtbC1
VAARALGVSESSLKRWCDRNFVQVTRTVGGHRKLAVSEVLRLARLQGRELVAPELLGLPPRRKGRNGEVTRSARFLAEALLAGHAESARQIIFDALASNHSLSELFDQVIAAAFETIGERWACGQADVYQERLACEIVQRILAELRMTQAVPTLGLALGATLDGDHYALASTMAQLVLRERGINATLLGTAIPADSCVRAVRSNKPQIFWLSVSHVPDRDKFLDEFSRLSAACHDCGAALVVGGRALTPELRATMVYSAFCDTMQQLDRFAMTFQKLPITTPPR